MRIAPLCLLAAAACHSPSPRAAGAAGAGPTSGDGPPPLALTLPGADGALSLDYLACDRAHGRVWVPAAGTGSVDVLDVATGKLTRVAGFPTAEREAHGTRRVVGPSSVTIGEGFAYAGDRADGAVYAIDVAHPARGNSLALPTPPDGLQYVGATKEVWVTTPRDASLTILDAREPSTLKPAGRVALDGAPEGYALDDARGLFFTNLEDRDRTLAIDVTTKRVIDTWAPGCGAAGPRGLAYDAARRFLFVACTDHVAVLDTARDGAIASTLDTGAGVDNIDYVEALSLLYVAAGKAMRLTVARVDASGRLTAAATWPTADGARVVVADAGGKAYVADGARGRLLVFDAPR